MSVPYRTRVVDRELRRRLASSGAVLIEGPRACGKTATGEQAAVSSVYLDLEPLLREMAEIDAAHILGEIESRPRLIDEWQTAPAIWNHVRRSIDASGGAPGQFILTGSAVPSDDVTRHTGAGRISRLRMRPMSLFESEHSTGDVSLGALLQGATVGAIHSEMTISDITERLVIGGWPSLITASPVDASQALRDYLDEISRTDISRVDDVRRDPRRVRRVIHSLARNVATEVATTTITEDAGVPSPSEDLALRSGPSRVTVIDYLNALERLMVIEDQPAWAPHIRSKIPLRGTAKRHFVDPSLAAGALGVSPEGLLRDLNYLGLLFESLVVRDLRIYAQAHGAVVSHYRDAKGTEVDAIVHAGSGSWAAIEVKLGGTESIETAATKLRTFVSKVDTKRMGEPSCLAVVVATGYGYTRPDGVAVIPLGTLAP